MSPTEHQRAVNRLSVFALIASVAVFLISSLYPGGDSLHQNSSAPLLLAYGWVWVQAWVMVLPGLMMGIAISRWRPKLGSIVGLLTMSVIPLLVLCDAIAFSWIGQRFLSRSVWRLVTLRESLAEHVAPGTLVFASVTPVTFALGVAFSWWVSGKLASRWSVLSSRIVLGVLVAVTIGLSVPAVWNWEATQTEMANHSARHPLFALALFDHRGVGRDALRDSVPAGGGEAGRMEALIVKREQRLEELNVRLSSEDLPDIVIVVIESFRHELVDPEVMPTLWQYAERGLHCRRHFSTGNATTHGMFGLFNGLEAVWYSRRMRSEPLLNRLLHQAGYEIGFFASHNDWRKFYMDGFINRQQFDVFETTEPNWLASDRTTTERAIAFLERADDGAQRQPRLAFLYLYSTHADYHSYPQDRIFQPASDDRFVIPFSTADAPQVWNRYRNSARSIDRFLAAILREDRVAIVTGDHGEAFLEDGTCGHGTRISQFQNMTPAVVYCPGKPPRQIDHPTMHGDLLPTLLASIGLELNDATAMDGVDLMVASDDELAKRLFVTRNYLDDDCALIGAGLGDAFGYRCAITLRDWTATMLNPIDQAGNEQETAGPDAQALLEQWIESRFGR